MTDNLTYNRKYNKNPVGRPKKKNQHALYVPIITNKIENIVSFHLKNLLMLKQISTLFKSLNFTDFYITFTETSIKFHMSNLLINVEASELMEYKYGYDRPYITISCITFKMNDMFLNINSVYEYGIFSLT